MANAKPPVGGSDKPNFRDNSKDDTDASFQSKHHTLGPKRYQGTPGSHRHIIGSDREGNISQTLFDPDVDIVSGDDNPALAELLQILTKYGLKDKSTGIVGGGTGGEDPGTGVAISHHNLQFLDEGDDHPQYLRQEEADLLYKFNRAPGVDGNDGEDGWSIPGIRGLQGIPGVNIPGIDGLDGEDGWTIPGPAGVNGIVGSNGRPGLDGLDGEDAWIVPGPQGLLGNQGLPGPPGFGVGIDGLDGEDGYPLPGPIGLIGNTGLTGPPGRPGIDGDDVAEVFTIPGDRGPIGLTGLPGINGLDGFDGDDGFSIPGPVGLQGVGIVGAPGVDGLDGEDGWHFPGPQGLVGSQGIQGLVGIPGLDGSDGEEGAVIPGQPGTIVTNGQGSVPFGALPGATDATLVITGQTGITANSFVEVKLRPFDSAQHSIDEYWVDGPRVEAGNIVPGVGFTIYAVTNDAYNKYGSWRVSWLWV